MAAAVDSSRKAVAELLGTGLLLAVVIGSGIMGEHLSGGNVGLALLANSIATGAGLVAIILTFGPISGAHLNPAVTMAEALRGTFPWAAVPSYVISQTLGAVLGTALAHLMFGEPIFAMSLHARSGAGQLLGEATATFGLLCVIRGAQRGAPGMVPFAVGGYITAAYWFTSSTSFANPAVTLARSFSSTFAGIRPADAPAFVIAQLVGTAAAVALWAWFDGAKAPAPCMNPKENQETAS